MLTVPGSINEPPAIVGLCYTLTDCCCNSQKININNPYRFRRLQAISPMCDTFVNGYVIPCGAVPCTYAAEEHNIMVWLVGTTPIFRYVASL